jgi:MAF protein
MLEDKPGVHKIVLASSSPYRRELLTRIGLEFETVSPRINESPQPHESPRQLAGRLAQMKAQSVADKRLDTIIIGSDQVAVIGVEKVGKPGNHAKAVEQLKRASGEVMEFYTGICVLNTASGHVQQDVVPFTVQFRRLDERTINNYLLQEKPYNCAGGFKSEGLGISLLERMSGDDPTALIGLPLIRLIRMLEQEGVTII